VSARLLLGLPAAILLVLAVAVGIDLASVRTQRVILAHRADAERFGSAVQRREPALAGQLARYDRANGIAVAVLDRAGRVRAASRPGLRGERLGPAADAALRGRRGGPAGPVWPWSGNRLVVAAPVIDGGDVVGAVVTLSPTSRLRESIARAWVVLALLALVAVLGCALLAARLRAEATVAALQRTFLADASHQLRNPLQALLLRLDGLSLRAEGDADVEAAAREGRHLAEILERLLQLAQVEAGEPRPEPLDLVPVVAERIAAWEPAAAAKGMTIALAGAPSCAALADAISLSSALDVVLDNAVKFGPPGSRVHVSVGADAVVRVRDEGPGLPPEQLRRAGDRFWRGPRHQNVDGSGLGQAIARTLLERGGARLELRPGRPAGLEVLVHLPRSNLPQIRSE
jgi:signal transduction histidine kinase